MSEGQVTEDIQDNGAEQQVEAKSSAGRVLFETRERLGLSIADAARQLRLSTRQVEALEADDYTQLPGKTFLRGFIRNYARLLQLDAEPLLASCQDAQPKDQAIVVPVSRIEFGGKHRFLPFSDHSRKPLPRFAIVVVVAVLLLLWGAYEVSQWQPQPSRNVPAKVESEAPLALPQPALAEAAAPLPGQPMAKEEGLPLSLPAPDETSVAPTPPAPALAPVPVMQPVPAPAPAQPPVSAPAPAPAPAPKADVSGRILEFAFDDDAWVEVKDKSGRIFSQLNPKGSRQLVRGNPPFSLVVGNAAHVRLTYNGQPVDLAPHVKVNVARLTLE